MPTVLWDASGLAKRYASEAGSATTDAVFAAVPLSDMAITPWGYLETYSILRRRFNGGILDAKALAASVAALQREVIISGDFGLIPISDSTIFAAASLIDVHQINSADAAILATYLRFQSRQPLGSLPCLLVAADKRLLRAANAEGLKTLNPEALAPGNVATFLAAI